MAIKTEILDKNVVESIKNLQNSAAELVHILGENHIRLRELEKERKQIVDSSTELETKYDGISKELNNLLGDLNQKYPNGEIDLVEGTVYFEVSE